MKEKRVTKKAILASLLSVAVCTSMLIGTSYAWFTDTVTSTGNKIVSGKLSIDFQAKKTDGTYESVDGQAVYNYERWEPGYVSWNNLKVTTDGNLALKYTLNFTSEGDIKNAKLAEAIDVYYAPGEITKPELNPGRPTTEQILAVESNEGTTDNGAQVNLRYLGTLQQAFQGGFAMQDTLIPADAVPAPGQDADTDDFATLVLVMREEAGNEYQNLSIPDFDVSIFATQYTYEIDTFDNQYDKDASVYTVSDADGFADALGLVQDGETIKLDDNLSLKTAMILSTDKQYTIDLNGKTISNENNNGQGFRVGAGDVTFTNGNITVPDQPVRIQSTTGNPVKVTIADDVTLTGDYGVTVHPNKDDATKKADVVVDMYGTINSTSGGVFVSGNIQGGNSVVNVYGSVTSNNEDATKRVAAISVNGLATVNVYDGAVVTGSTAVEVRAGNLNVYGGTFTATADELYCAGNGSGTTTRGVGLAVVPYTSIYDDIAVNVTGGTFSAPYAFYANNIQNANNAVLDKVTVNISGGTFTSTVATDAFTVNNNMTGWHYNNG